MSNLPLIVDTTLRDGEQSPGVAFSPADKAALLLALVAAGVPEIEAGIPAMGPEEGEDYAMLAALAGGVPVIAWNRMLRGDAEAALACGARDLHLSVPASDAMLSLKLGKNRAWAREQVDGVVAFCVDSGARVVVGAEDASRADPGFLAELATLAAARGARRFRVADTVGILTPTGVRGLLAQLVDRVDIPVEFHAHNDLGLATANALAAIEAGAQAVSCTLLGLGERAGNAALEEVVVALATAVGRPSAVDLTTLPNLCALAAAAARRPIPPQKAICGPLAFTHESGIHVDGLLKDPSLYSPFDPALVGRTHSFVPGRHSGRAAIRLLARQEGRTIGEEALDEIAKTVKNVWRGGAPEDPWRAFEAILDAVGTSLDQ